MDWAKLEDQWSEDDEEDEKITESAVLEAEIERKKAEAQDLDVRRLSKMSPEKAREFAANQQTTGELASRRDAASCKLIDVLTN